MTIALENVTVTRGKKNILDNVNFHVSTGEFTAVCGPNGAGKTTALGVISGSTAPSFGTAYFDDFALDSLHPKELAFRRAVLPQIPSLGFPFLVHEVVEMGRAPHHGRVTPAKDAEAVEAAMNAVQISHMADRNYLTLSGGEKQRVQIARVIAQLWFEPEDGGQRWLLLDEPTSALDLKHQLRLMRLLSELSSKGWGVFAVLHDLALIRKWADRAILMANARVVGDGPAEDVLNAKAIADAFELDEPYEVEPDNGVLATVR